MAWPRIVVWGALGAAIVRCASEAPPAPPPVVVAPAPVQPVLPTADALFEGAVSAMGGRARLLEVEGWSGRGRVTVTSSRAEDFEPLEGTLELWARAPDLALTVIRLDGGPELRMGFDGARGWRRVGSGEVEPAAGATSPLPLHAVTQFALRFPARETLGPADFAGRPAWEVEVRTATGTPERRYFDAESGHLLGSRLEVEGLGTETRFGARRAIEGLELPTRVEVRRAGQLQVFELDEIRLEAAPLERFAPPS